MAADEVAWKDGTIYDEKLWGSGFAKSTADWGSSAGAKYDADGKIIGYGAATGGGAATVFNNPAMQVIRVSVNLSVDARFQPLYYVEKQYSLYGPWPESKGDFQILALGTGALVGFNIFYYMYYDNGSDFVQVENGGSNKLSFDLNAGLSFNSGGASATFGVSAFSAKYEQILGELLLSWPMALVIN
jgi:hypothetical protein